VLVAREHVRSIVLQGRGFADAPARGRNIPFWERVRVDKGG
jgi:hypothetical protein